METRIKAVEKLNLKKGDVVLVKLGGEVQDGLPLWIPGEEELAYEGAAWEAITPPGVNVIVHHSLINLQIIEGLDEIKTLVIVPAEKDGKEG